MLNKLVSIDHRSDIPIYVQIVNSIISRIHRGQLMPGIRLPASREAAAQLAVNRMTIVAAYDELRLQGWIEMIPKRGTFVTQVLPLIERQIKSPVARVEPWFPLNGKKIFTLEVTDFPPNNGIVVNDGFPDPRIVPMDELARAIRRSFRMKSNARFLLYGGAQGTLQLRLALTKFLNESRNLNTRPENILVTKGAQMAIFVAASVLLRANDTVVVGEPGYTTATATFWQLGAAVLSVPVDGDGLVVDALEKICSRRKVRMVYVIPHHHNPTTVSLSPERRIKLLELARKYRFAILEDDYDFDFHYAGKPLLPIASLDQHGSVIYIGTLSKTLAPSIRIGFLVAPAKFIQLATRFRKSVDTQGDSFLENAVAELFTDGTIGAHIRKSVRLYRERRDTFCEHLSKLGRHVSFLPPLGGMSVWVSFRSDLRKISEQARKHGIYLKDGTAYDTGHSTYNAVRMGFASLNSSEQRKVIDVIESVLKQ